jgi:hypothetical protein
MKETNLLISIFKVFYIDNETSGYIDSSELNETFDIQCLWYIHAPEGYGIHFHFADFNLKEFAYCLHDSIIIVDGGEIDECVIGDLDVVTESGSGLVIEG